MCSERLRCRGEASLQMQQPEQAGIPVSLHFPSLRALRGEDSSGASLRSRSPWRSGTLVWNGLGRYCLVLGAFSGPTCLNDRNIPYPTSSPFPKEPDNETEIRKDSPCGAEEKEVRFIEHRSCWRVTYTSRRLLSEVQPRGTRCPALASAPAKCPPSGKTEAATGHPTLQSQ